MARLLSAVPEVFDLPCLPLGTNLPFAMEATLHFERNRTIQSIPCKRLKFLSLKAMRGARRLLFSGAQCALGDAELVAFDLELIAGLRGVDLSGRCFSILLCLSCSLTANLWRRQPEFAA